MSTYSANFSSEFILSEVQKLQYLYGLKHEIRYAQKRPEGLFTESVAEHIYGMHICAQYFLPLENPEGTWDRARIYEMITLHDIDEIETGDMLGYFKTDTERDGEREAKIAVLKKSPTHLQANFESITTEYENQETIEARFVKAVDRFEPLIQIYSQFGTHVIQKNKTTEEQSRRIKVPYIKPFPTMYQYSYVVHEAMINEGYFILKD